ncbi:MAG TPA: class I SAM-dependent methyltransferase [Solirubrobacteraceae bacterium]|jgi:SAM-dependent methyltransferase
MPEQEGVNRRVWERGGHVEEYANRQLLPVEVLLLVRYREAVSGRSLELGCGAGRILGYLAALGGEVRGIDISPAMVDHCRAAFPAADVKVGDLADLAESLGGDYNAILAMDNVLDVLDDAGRRRLLAQLRAMLGEDGLLVFSTHNLDYVDGPAHRAAPTDQTGGTVSRVLRGAAGRPLSDVPRLARRLPKRIRNRRQLGPLERREPGYAILNDSAHDYSFLHYYIRAPDQVRQLKEAGFELVECLDVDGGHVAADRGAGDPWLHYVARPAR